MSHVRFSRRYRKGPGWSAAAARFDESGDDAWCGPVGPAPSLGYFGWAIWFSEYWRIAPPVEDRLVTDALDIAVENAMYRLPPEPGDPFGIEHHERMLASGARIRLLGAMSAELAEPPPVKEYLIERFRQSRRIGRRHGKWMAAFLPLLLLMRWYGAALRKPRYLLRALAAAPVLALFSAVQAAGEFAGPPRRE